MNAEEPSDVPALVAWPARGATSVPEGCVGLRVHASQLLQRLSGGTRLSAYEPHADESIWIAPLRSHQLILALNPAARDVGLFAAVEIADASDGIDANRFEAYLAAKPEAALRPDSLASEIQSWLQAALHQGTLDLPPCETADEWRSFRLALGHAIHARFGIAIGECFLVDLFGVTLTCDAAPTVTMAADSSEPDVAMQSASRQAPRSQAPIERYVAGTENTVDKRLFIELPRLARALRAPNLPQEDTAVVLRQLELARRLDALARRASLRARRRTATSKGSRQTAQDLDDAWAVVADLGRQVQMPTASTSLYLVLDEADRVLANLESAIGSGLGA